MATPTFETVDDYIAAAPPAARDALALVRDAIQTALPDAEESIAYGMPAYRVDGRPVIYFAGWKAHYSLYPAPAALATLGRDAAALKVSKGTLRFPLGEPVPSRLVARIARLRAKEASARASAAPAVTADAPARRRAGSARASVVRSR